MIISIVLCNSMVYLGTTVFTHHCFWFGHCIGVNNKKEFYAFLVLSFVFPIYLMINIILFGKLNHYPYYKGFLLLKCIQLLLAIFMKTKVEKI